MKWHTNDVRSWTETPLGPLHLSASRQGLTAAWFPDQRHLPGPTEVERWAIDHAHPLLQAARQQIDAYFKGERQHFDLPLDLSSGTDFQQDVWRALLGITEGATLSYGEVARQIGRPAAVRAVGGAIGRNPISIIVPCHRVLGTNGSLTGYSGGLHRKIALLQREGVIA